MRVSVIVLLAISFFTSAAQEKVMISDKPAIPSRPVHTYSIVARDPNTGELGVAVQSHWFSVGPIVRGRKRALARLQHNRLWIRVTERTDLT
jgi:hypothetical protein